MRLGSQGVTAEQDEMVVFIKGEASRGCVPWGIVTHSSQELEELFGSGKPELAVKHLRLIHEAKRAGGEVTDHLFVTRQSPNCSVFSPNASL
jgi:hypothetical protein